MHTLQWSAIAAMLCCQWAAWPVTCVESTVGVCFQAPVEGFVGGSNLKTSGDSLVRTAEECARACVAATRCAAFMWRDASSRSPAKCVLKSLESATVAASAMQQDAPWKLRYRFYSRKRAATAGICQPWGLHVTHNPPDSTLAAHAANCTETFLDQGPGLVKRLAHLAKFKRIASARLCSSRCRQNVACLAFAYRPTTKKCTLSKWSSVRAQHTTKNAHRMWQFYNRVTTCQVAIPADSKDLHTSKAPLAAALVCWIRMPTGCGGSSRRPNSGSAAGDSDWFKAWFADGRPSRSACARSTETSNMYCDRNDTQWFWGDAHPSTRPTTPTTATTSTPVPYQKPHIFVFMADDLTYGDIGFQGNDVVKTPTIDKFAQGGVAFSQMHTTSATCAPSRTSFQTGLYPFRHGAFTNHASTKTDIVTMPFYMTQMGYITLFGGKTHLKPANMFPYHYFGYVNDIRAQTAKVGNYQTIKADEAKKAAAAAATAPEFRNTSSGYWDDMDDELVATEDIHDPELRWTSQVHPLGAFSGIDVNNPRYGITHTLLQDVIDSKLAANPLNHGNNTPWFIMHNSMDPHGQSPFLRRVLPVCVP